MMHAHRFDRRRVAWPVSRRGLLHAGHASRHGPAPLCVLPVRPLPVWGLPVRPARALGRARRDLPGLPLLRTVLQLPGVRAGSRAARALLDALVLVPRRPVSLKRLVEPVAVLLALLWVVIAVAAQSVFGAILAVIALLWALGIEMVDGEGGDV